MTKINFVEFNKLTEQVIGAAIEVHCHLGPGLLESAYETCLAYELDRLILKFERQKHFPLVYKKNPGRSRIQGGPSGGR
jgi:GxxExxY protein